MVDTQFIRQMSYLRPLARSGPRASAFAAEAPSLKVFNTARSGLTKLHRKKPTSTPSGKNVGNQSIAKTKQGKEVDRAERHEASFPAEQWEELSQISHAFNQRLKAFKNDRFEQPIVNLKIQPATEPRISALLRPAPLIKVLKATFNNRNYRGVHVGKALANKLDKMLGKSVEGQKKRKAIFDKSDLSQKISYQKPGEGIHDINVFDWLENLFAEPAPKKRFKHNIHQLESAVNDFSQSENMEDVKKINSTYGQGNFFELRAGLAFDYLKAKGEIIDYKQTVSNSYLDHLGIDFLVRAKFDDKVKILAVQIKSSQSSANEFYQPKQLLHYNFRKRQPLNTKNQRRGIVLINMQGKSLSRIADEVSAYIGTKALRSEKGIRLIPDFDFSRDLDFDKLRDWYQVLEKAFVGPVKQEEQAA